MTFVEVRRARPVNYTSFAHITDVELAEILPHGLDFAGDLTPEEATDVWWFASSSDDADETARRALWTTRNTEGTCACCQQVIDYMLGEVP